MFTIDKNNKDEIIIKNSKFIGLIYKIENEDEINNILNNLKKEYKDATHITYAWKLKDKQKYNDDREPTGTAGVPIMEAINKNDLVNVLIVVVRYFGGIKLGAGGLIRAYSKTAREVLKKCKLEKYIIYNYYELKTNYDNLKLLNNLTKDLIIEKKEFDEDIIYIVKTTEKIDNIEKIFKNTEIKIKEI